MKIGVYIRVSTNEQNSDNQTIALTDYAKEKGWDIYKVYVDHETGTQGRATRKAFDTMLKDAKKGRFKLLLIWALDRLTREGMYTTINYLQILDSCGVAFHSFQEQVLNTENEMVRSVALALMASLAKIEAQKISERTKAGLQRARRQGKTLGRPSKRKYKDDILDMVKEGKADSVIMKELGLSRNTVKKYKREAGLLV